MIQENVLLKDYTNYKIGGPARYFLKTDDLEKLKSELAEWQSHAENRALPIFVLGGATNVLASDDGFPGLVIHFDDQTISKTDNNIVKVGAGTTIDELNQYLIDHALSGFEWSGGLPGTVGGAVFGNAGAFGGETKDNVAEVESLDLKTLTIKKRDNSSCEFGYRSSIFKNKLAQKELILSISFKFKEGNPEEIRAAVKEKVDYRNNRQPLDFPSAGSTFKNVPADTVPVDIKEKFKDKIKNDPFPVIPAAVFLADAGLKGLSINGAKVSEKHPNFLINTGSAKAKDIEALIAKIISIIQEKYNITLEPEIIKLG